MILISQSDNTYVLAASPLAPSGFWKVKKVKIIPNPGALRPSPNVIQFKDKGQCFGNITVAKEKLRLRFITYYSPNDGDIASRYLFSHIVKLYDICLGSNAG